MSNIDELSNEELEASLVDALKSGTENSDGDAAPENKPESKSPEAAPEAKPAEDGGDKGDNDEDGEGEGENRNPYKKRIDRLLRRSNRLEAEKAEKDAEIARLKAQKAPQTDQKPAEEDDNEDEEVPNKKETPEEIFERKFNEREHKNLLDRVDQEELDELFTDVPNARERKNQILELSKKHPTLSFRAIDMLIAPVDHVDPIEVNRKSANNMGTGNRSKADLANEPDPKKMSTSDLDKLVRDGVKTGSLVL